MPDKERERYYLGKLKQCIELRNTIEDTEQPDFLLGNHPNRIGIELTVYHHPPTPGKRVHQEVQSLKNRVVKIAEQLHREAGGPALYLSVIFGPHGCLSKKTVRPIAKALSDAVLSGPAPKSPYDPRVKIERDRLPREIAHVSFSASIDGQDKLWQADAGGFVMTVKPSDIQREIDKKQHMIGIARTKCDALWLVIVHDLVRGTPCELSAEAKSASYRHDFDRVLLLDPHLPRITELCVAPTLSLSKVNKDEVGSNA
jgi:hypothetical protein